MAANTEDIALLTSRFGWRLAALAAALALSLAGAARAGDNGDAGGDDAGGNDQGDQAQEDSQPKFPATQFADGAKSASVTVGDLTAGISLVRRPEIDANLDVPVLEVMVGGVRVLETPGVPSGLDQPATEAVIAKIDPANKHPEVYFSSYSGGAHCCTHVVVAEESGGKWVAVTIGDFDGDGRLLADLDKDGVAEVVTVDNRFLYQFDCYACSSAPLKIYTVRDGKAVDVTGDKRYQPALRDWLKRMEDDADPEQRWSSPGFLAGWVAEKVLVGEGVDAFKQLTDHWDSAADVGEEVCTTGGELDSCAKKNRAVLKFPDRLKLFLQQTGYAF
jgi:hypothetical protein